MSVGGENSALARVNAEQVSIWTRNPWLKGTLATLLLNLLILTPIAVSTLPHVGAPWGAGDMTYFYFMSWTWELFRHASTNSVSFPFGIDPNAFSGLDGLIYFLSKPISVLLGNPYVGLNLLLLASFPVVALLAFAAIRLVGLSGPLAAILANAFSFIPFHFGRGIGHLPLGMMLGLTTGVLLALLVGAGRLQGWFTTSSIRSKILPGLLTLGLIVVTAWTGLYYAFFGSILLLAAIIWRISAGDSLRKLLPGIVTLGSLVVAVALGLSIVLLSRSESAAAASVSLRDPMDSVTYAGNLAIAFIPQPYSILSSAYNEFIFEIFSQAPANEAHLMANFGTWITSIAALVYLVGLVTYRRQLKARTQTLAQMHERTTDNGLVSINYITYLLIVTIGLFVPWGFNYLFSSFVTAQIRAWNRLLPYVLLLLLLGACSALASWKWPRKRLIALVVSPFLLALILIDMVLPWRNLYTYVPADGQSRIDMAQQYAVEVNAAIPRECGVLTLPFISYPGAGPVGQMDDYDHFTIAMTNPEKKISYGAFANSSAAIDFQRLSALPLDDSLWELQSLGYCGVHVDSRGFEDPQLILSDLQRTLGGPVATQGPWTMFALPRT